MGLPGSNTFLATKLRVLRLGFFNSLLSSCWGKWTSVLFAWNKEFVGNKTQWSTEINSLTSWMGLASFRWCAWTDPLLSFFGKTFIRNWGRKNLGSWSIPSYPQSSLLILCLWKIQMLRMNGKMRAVLLIECGRREWIWKVENWSPLPAKAQGWKHLNCSFP